MPIYEYFCKTCGKETQETRGISEAQRITECECGETLIRRFSVSNVTFSGTGFYSTDKKEK